MGPAAEARAASFWESVNLLRKVGGQGRDRTADTAIFSRMLYQLSYLATVCARWVGTEKRL